MAAIAIVVCDHGFGHVRRSLLIGGRLRESGHDVTVYAPRTAVDRFAHTGLAIQDFHAGITPDALRKDALPDWRPALSALDRFDLVISDNLVEVLAFRSDAILTGSFLWHLSLTDIHSRLAEAAEGLLAAHRPMMIASRLFALPGLAERTQLSLVGLYASAHSTGNGADLLISCGGTETMAASYAAALEKIAEEPSPGFIVWAEPRIIPRQPPDWMRPAAFDLAAMQKIAAVVCRPGVGTVTDCLQAGARCFSVFEDGNIEMAFNASCLLGAEVGETALNVMAAYKMATRFIGDERQRAAHAAAISRLSFDGVSETAALIGAQLSSA